jgi:hypothetical protein
MGDPDIRVDLATELAVIDGTETRLWCQELYVAGRFDHATEWTSSIAQAVKDGRTLREQALSDWAYREARYEVARLFTHAA